MLQGATTTTLSAVGKIADIFKSAKADSLVEYTKDTRVEPIVIMEGSLRHQEYITEVLQTLSSIFAGYYLQAVSVSVNVGNVDTTRLLGKLSTNRDPAESALSSNYINLISNEDYQDRLPNYNVSAEARSLREQLFGEDGEQPTRSGGSGRGASENVSTPTNLAVGKHFDVTINSNGETATIPMAIRLNVKQMGQRDVLHILSVGVKDNSARERYHKWRAGELEFMRDIVLCQDIIDAHRKTLMSDDTNIYQKMLGNRRNNRLSAILSGNPSVNTASGIVVVTAETAKKLEREMGGKLSNFRKREKLFKEAFIMLMVVVDTEWDQLTFYHRSIDGESELSVKELKQTNKGTGPDVTDILKAYQMSSAPSL